MKVDAQFISLTCTKGSSNKGYTLIKLDVVIGVRTRQWLINCYGPLDNCNQMIWTDTDVEDNHFRTLKSKLKTYQKFGAPNHLIYTSAQKEELCKLFVARLEGFLEKHGPFSHLSNALIAKLDRLVDEEIAPFIMNSEDPDSLEAATPPMAAIDHSSLDDWGAF